MIVLVIICIMAVVYFVGSGESKRADKKGSTTVGAAILAAHDTECIEHLRQLRQSLQIAGTSGDYPQTLEETNLGEEFYKCPLGGERYEYDPSTGKVKCPHPGHGKY